MHQCIHCQCEVPDARVEALRDMHRPTTCLECSDKHTPERKAYMVFTHKTAPELTFVEGQENIRQADRAFNRER